MAATNDTCVACRREIDTDSVALKDVGKYHSACFVCSVCKGGLDAVHFKSGALYCSADYNAAHGQKCAACGLFVGTRVVNAGADAYHAECFKCASCMVIMEGGYVVRDGFNFCDSECANTGLRCAECGSVLSGSISKIGALRYHPECVKCKTCKVPLGDDMKSKNGFVFCPPCYQLKYGVFCYACSKYCDDTRLKAMGHHWHPACFVCSACRAPFVDNAFVVASDKPYCSEACAGL